MAPPTESAPSASLSPSPSATIDSTAIDPALRRLGLVALLLLLWLVRPLAAPLLVAAVLAGTLHGPHARLTRRWRGHRRLVALLLVGAVALAVVLLAGSLAVSLLQQAAQLIQWLRATLGSGEAARWVGERLPSPLRPMGEAALRAGTALAEPAGGWVEAGLTALPQLWQATGSALRLTIRGLLSLVAAWFLLVDGPALVGWLAQASPLGPQRTRALLEEFRRVAVAVVSSTLLTAAAQTVAALIGFWLAGAPQPLLLSLLTFGCALLPAVGAALVPVLASGLLWVSGHGGRALLLLLWGLLVVGLVDNVIKPMLIRHGMDLPGVIVFFSLIAGLMAFGPVGLLAGPLVVALAMAVLRLQRQQARRTRPGALERLRS